MADFPSRFVPFESVTVDPRGQVVARQAGTALVYTDDLGGATLETVVIPAGRFLMGSRPGEGYEDERPQHSVSVAPFLLGRAPVTQAQWLAVMGRLPPVRCRGSRLPVDRVSWRDAVRFCRRLALRTRRPYRLPGEAEWEYACRAGTLTPFSCGETITTDLANYVGDHVYRLEPPGVYRHTSTEAGIFPPNPFGLLDMHGNVWEWCADAWHDSYDGVRAAGAPADGSVWQGSPGLKRLLGRGLRAGPRVLRGGCWHDPPDLSRSAARLRSAPREAEDYFGFRVAMTAA
jgi:formylglycine-generating enzyme required for sulfatase activity